MLDNGPAEMEFLNQFVDKGLLDRLNHVLNSEFKRLIIQKLSIQLYVSQ